MLVAWPFSWVDTLLRHALFLALYVALAVAFAPMDKEGYRRPFAFEPGRGAGAAGNGRGGGGARGPAAAAAAAPVG